MDSLSAWLRTIHVDRLSVELLETRGPWWVPIPTHPQPTSTLFVVTAGEVWVEATGRPQSRVRYREGELGVLLPGHTFVACTSPTELCAAQPARPRTAVPFIRWGERGPATNVASLVCGLRAHDRWSLARLLPPVGHHGADAAVCGGMLHDLVERHRAGRPGTAAALERLAELVLVQTLAAAFERCEPPVAAALPDPPIAAALALIHADPGAPWTVASLARKVALSRTVFSARFRACVGQPPIGYLARHRMDRAHALLTTTGLPLAEIARRVGYAELATFGRAFKRAHERSPGQVRRQATRATP